MCCRRNHDEGPVTVLPKRPFTPEGLDGRHGEEVQNARAGGGSKAGLTRDVRNQLLRLVEEYGCWEGASTVKGEEKKNRVSSSSRSCASAPSGQMRRTGGITRW